MSERESEGGRQYSPATAAWWRRDTGDRSVYTVAIATEWEIEWDKRQQGFRLETLATIEPPTPLRVARFDTSDHGNAKGERAATLVQYSSMTKEDRGLRFVHFGSGCSSEL